MDKEKRKELIIEKARELFAVFGFKKTTMDEIATKCGMSKATLYYYFESKEDVFRAVIDFEFDIFKGKMDEAISKAKTPSDKIRSFFVNRFIYIKELANYYRTITSEYLEHYAFIEHERLKFNHWEIQSLQSILYEGVEKGMFDISDTRATAIAFVFALRGLEHPILFRQDIIDTEHATDILLPVLFKGIEKK